MNLGQFNVESIFMQNLPILQDKVVFMRKQAVLPQLISGSKIGLESHRYLYSCETDLFLQDMFQCVKLGHFTSECIFMRKQANFQGCSISMRKQPVLQRST